MTSRFLLLLTLFMFLIAACNDDSDNVENQGANTPEVTATEASVSTAEAASRPLVLGDISDDPTRRIRRTQPLADYLAANLADLGITGGEVRIAPDLDTMIDWIKNGEVDLYFDSLYPAMLISDATGAQPILRRWRDGVAEYNTVFFARQDSGFTSLDDLKGHIIAFDEETSTSGYMVPLAYMVEAGLSAVAKDSASASVGVDEIGYAFSGGDENTMQWVVSNRVSAGVVDNVTYAEFPEETRNELVILGETETIPRQVVLAGAHLSPELVAAITALLVNLDEAEGGAEILDEFQTNQFDEFPEGVDAAFTRMRELYEMAQSQ